MGMVYWMTGIRVIVVLWVMTLAMKIRDLIGSYWNEFENADSAPQATQLSNEFILESIVNFSSLFAVVSIWAIIEMAIFTITYKAGKNNGRAITSDTEQHVCQQDTREEFKN